MSRAGAMGRPVARLSLILGLALAPEMRGLRAEPAGVLPMPGRTLLLVGQTWTREFQDYVEGTGRAPAGSSHYGELYRGIVNQGDDGRDLAHLRAVQAGYPCAYANVAISWKDNPDLSDHPRDACGDFTGRRIYQVNLDIVAGKYDAAIDSFAAVMKSRPAMRFLVRIEYEAGRYLFAWKDRSRCPVPGQGLDFSDTALFDPTAFHRAYNHVARRLRKVNGVDNAAFVYHPVRGYGDAVALYPGPEYVDLIALSVFNHDVCIGAPWCGPDDLLEPDVARIFAWAKGTAGKPLMIAESAPQRPATGSDAGFTGYLDRLLGAVESHDVRVLCYINSDWNAHGWDANWGDSRVETRPAVKAYWASRVLSNPRYVQYGCGPDSLFTAGVRSRGGRSPGARTRPGLEFRWDGRMLRSPSR